ncbi:MAG: hypothetical protein Q8L35_07905, partial [Actinomycetota bacterium]|nr:hypothetical protein [Actinomycetota bacterium]
MVKYFKIKAAPAAGEEEMMKKVLYALIIITLIAGGAWLVRPDGDKPAGKKTGSANAERLVERVNEAVDAGDLPAAKSA